MGLKTIILHCNVYVLVGTFSNIPISYLRAGHNRIIECTARVRWISHQIGVPIKWLGTRLSLQHLIFNAPRCIWSAQARETSATIARRLIAYHLWRFFWKI